ncbi:MAG: DNA polymerase III subunit delta, partial [Planctomycetia bacterium]|nr:DNA polymerase III subunit delta [Planctomycetia bacterium]
LCAIVGADAFLRSRSDARLREAMCALGGRDAEFSISISDGASPQTLFRDVISDLSTKSLFGGGPRRLVIVEQADDFIDRNRPELEIYAAQARTASILVLEPTSFPSNTRLAKAFEKNGVVIDCAVPKEGEVRRWLDRWADRRYQVRLDPDAADRLLERVGPSPGLLDQELAKLSQTALNAAESASGDGKRSGSSSRITLQMVDQLSGNWRTRGVWELFDQVLNGNVPATLEQLDRLLSVGESPIMVLASVSATLRRFAAATRLLSQASEERRPMTIQDALKQVGVKPFLLAKSESQLRRLGRERASRLYTELVRADLGLKGDSRLPPRLILERFLITLARDRVPSR